MKKLTTEEINERLDQLDGWDYTEKAIQTTFEFADFKETFSIMTRIAFECEAQNHHPEWTNVYKTLTIRLSTHDADGVTEKDFKLAATIENIIESE
ncbi:MULTISPECIES: 4a-hydroxytetrahydrobiopterin dehydratase [Sediminicola]|uniref:Putative pterin-4-alpha-carbinolamine dehydratase n=1 Tax=Sediminicola luteus TaxID=319238 RepID=A0ABV2TY37_9FLAO|nr:4a-hydroxytetrahydrobiopterin dehydratase [Sediminicola sp. YIK13]ALM06728.1 pterin-4-alpha-carbinolamine dehydratase [Sediminicola sp. YIK13]